LYSLHTPEIGRKLDEPVNGFRKSFLGFGPAQRFQRKTNVPAIQYPSRFFDVID
jgi:hypothetical protein